jgi:hypothetical protein
MDEHRHNILLVHVIFMIIWHVIFIVATLRQFVFYQHYNAMTTMVALVMEINGASRETCMDI